MYLQLENTRHYGQTKTTLAIPGHPSHFDHPKTPTGHPPIIHRLYMVNFKRAIYLSGVSGGWGLSYSGNKSYLRSQLNLH